ncbi:MAG: preprotein translocase subunit YajC [Campylobacterales bacterium]
MQDGGGLLASLLPLVVLFAIFYFLIIRPQQKQAKQHKEMLASLKKGDNIVTNGGLMVDILKVEEDFLSVKLSDNTTARVSREFVAKKLDDEK